MSEKEKQPQRQFSKKNIAAGLAVLIIACFAFWLWQKTAVKREPFVPADMGVVDMQQVMRHHPQYQKLMQLLGEKLLLEQKISQQESSGLSPALMQPLKPQAFFGVAEQKVQMEAYNSYHLLQNELVLKRKKLQENMAVPEKEAIKQINAAYENIIFNCTLQLDNADNLRLDDEQIAALQERLLQLKKERDGKIAAVKKSYLSLIEKELGAYRDKRLGEISEQAEAQRAQQLMEANSKAQDFQNQSAAILKDKLTAAAEKKASLQKLYLEISNKNEEIKALRQAMVQDIKSQAMRLAIKEHLSLVIAADSAPVNITLPFEVLFEHSLQNQVALTDKVKDITPQLISYYEQQATPNS